MYEEARSSLLVVLLVALLGKYVLVFRRPEHNKSQMCSVTEQVTVTALAMEMATDQCPLSHRQDEIT
jgi:hypothetical protein